MPLDFFRDCTGSDGEYGHPQHVFTHQAVWTALEKVRPWRPSEILTWCANYGDNADDRVTNRSDPADLVLDVEPWIEAKAAAADCHRSQHAMFKRNRKVFHGLVLRRISAIG